MLHFMNSKVVDKLKSKVKEDLVLINQRRTRMRYNTSQYPAYLMIAWVWRLQIHYLSPAHNPMQIWSNFIQLYPSLFSNILMYMEKLMLMDIAQKIIWNTYVKPRNSCVHTYMMNLDECLMNINILMKNINILMKNTTTFWWSECSPWISSKSLWSPGHVT